MALPSAPFRQSQCNPPATDAKSLSNGSTSISRVACTACGGFGCPGITATFHIFNRLQVTKFSLLNSAPNGLKYMDIRRLFLHGRFQVNGLGRYCKYLIFFSTTKRNL